MKMAEQHKPEALVTAQERSLSLLEDCGLGLESLSALVRQTNSGKKKMGEVVEEESHYLLANRYMRAEATLLAITSSTSYFESKENPQKYTAGKSGRSWGHRFLEDEYQVGALIEALAREDISLEDFGIACGIQKETFEANLSLVAGSSEPNLDEQKNKKLWVGEMAGMISELETYQLAVASTLTRVQT